MKKWILTLGILFIAGALAGQVDTLLYLQQAEESIEEISSASEEQEYSAEELLEELEEYDGPLNLNTLSYSAAVQRLGLSDYQYYQLQLYIEESGALVSVYELAAIAGFSQQDMERLEPLVVAEPIPKKKEFWKNLFKRCRNTLIVRDSWVLERQAGYDTSRPTHYDGSRDHLCFRYTFNSQDKLLIKISGEKDAGEQFFRGQQRYGFDFYSGSLALKGFGILRQAVIGDYRLNFGQGLVMGNSMLSGRGGDISQLRRFSTGIRAVAPTNESDFLRGTAVTIGNTAIQGTIFAGQQAGTNNYATGANIAFVHRHFRIGGRIASFFLRDTSSLRPPEYHLLTFQNLSAGIDYQTTIKKTLLYGEFSVTNSGKIAAMQGVNIALTPITRLAVIFRHYDIGFSAPLGKAFGANSKNSGETGLYLSVQHILNRKMELRTYFDYYLLRTPTYRLDAPVSVFDGGVALVCNLTRNNHLNLTYTFRGKSINGNESPYYNVLREQQQHRLRLVWQYQPSAHVSCKSGITWRITVLRQPSEHYQGLLLYQDVGVKCWKDRIAINARIAYFDTDRYDERLYAYENDVYYAFTIGSYYYQGVRGYLVLRFKYRFFTIWARVGQTYYIDRKIISSGLTQINKPHKTELRVQVAWNW
ncbi:MAG: hypothetical protein K6A41_01780 [Bacteroidales bacterium]|nr:hypothetical protein [Bacteroidales bacterium]